MQLLAPLSTLTLLLTTVVLGIVASPVEQSPRNAALEDRAAAALINRQCISPAQINLSGDPGLNSLNNLGHCGWKMWVACTSLAAGVCVIPCAEGGLADPACDICLGALGGLGCKMCIQNEELWTSVMQDIATVQPKVVARIQSDYCETPKKSIPSLKLPNSVGPTLTATNSLMLSSAAALVAETPLPTA